jgi:hypothetical protein
MDCRNTLNIYGHNYVMTFDSDSEYLHPILEPLRLKDPSHITEYTSFLPVSLCLPTVTTSNFAQRRSSSRDCPT